MDIPGEDSAKFEAKKRGKLALLTMAAFTLGTAWGAVAYWMATR